MIVIRHPIVAHDCLSLQSVLNKDKFSSITHLTSNLTGLREEYYIGAFDGDRLVGLAVLAGSGDLAKEIYKLYVDPAYRGQNIASKLVDEALRYSKKEGSECIDVEVSSSGNAFWCKYNFGYKHSTAGDRISIWLTEPPRWLDEVQEIQKSWCIRDEPEKSSD